MKDEPKKKPNILVRLITFLVTLALILGAVTLVVYRDRLNLDAFQRWLSYRGLETSETGEAAQFSYGGGTGVSVSCLDNALLFSSNNSVRLYTNSGTELHSEVLSLNNPILTSTGKLGVVYDMGGQELRAFDSRGQVFSLTLDEGYGFLSARPNTSGWLAVVNQQSGYKGVVTVYDGSFSPKMEIDYSSAFVVDAALSDDNRSVAVITMGQGSQSFESRVVLYSLGQEEALATVSLGNTTVLDLQHSSQTIRALGENALFLLSADGETQNTYSFSDRYLKGYELGGDSFSLLLLGRYRAGAANELAVVGDDGSLLGTLTPDTQVLDLSAAGRYFGVLTADRLDIYTDDLTLYATLADTQGARSISLREDGTALLANSEQAWLYLP